MPTLIVVDAQGTENRIEAAIGLSVMEVIRDSGFGHVGECGGSMACASCHVIVDPTWADKVPEITEDEEDMLDTVFDLEATSRLSCQIKIEEALDGLRIRVPG